MIIAALLAVIGFLSVAILTQRYGYRLGGTITASVLAVYTLKSAVMLPVFVTSTVIAYLGLWVLKERTLVYGRTELIVAIFVGSVVPLAVLFWLATVANETVRAVLLIGSILPGLAAYNYHQLKPGQRRKDLVAACGLMVGLLALGFVLVTPANAARFGGLTPPVLFAQTADIAVYKGATVAAPAEPALIYQRLGAGILLVGMALAEVSRARFGVRIGVISLALLAIFALASVWLLVVFGIVLVAAFVAIETINRTTLLYGRVLIGVGAALSVLLAVPLSAELPVVRGLSALFVGILGGIGAYNLHVTPSGHRRIYVTLSLAVFCPLLALALLVGRPQPNALVNSLDSTTLAALAVVTVVSFGLTRWVTPSLPDDESVFAGSILSDGDGA